MSRMISAGLLTAGFAFALGCGSEPAPTPAAKPPENPAPAPGPNPDPSAGAPKAEPPKLAWELDQTKHAIPAAAVRGRMMGAEITPKATLEGTELTFHALKADTGVAERSIKLNLAPMLVAGQALPPVVGGEWKVKLDAPPGPTVPEVWIEVPGKDPYFFQSGYALTLELGQSKDGKVAGKIYFCLPDEGQSVLAGTFEAAYFRSYTEPPGPDDVPYVAGEVTVIGAKPDAELRVGLAAFTATRAYFRESLFPLRVPSGQTPPVTKEETSRFVPGDGVRPFRYEHVRFAHGRYLLTAAVSGGPTVWKWVDVAAGTALTENFALDTTKAGGVEVSVPPGVTGTVLVAPADDPAKQALELELFRSLALLVARQGVEVVGGKALVKNLAPGKYEVRAGDLRGFVDVAAGKTAELTLAPPKK